jgi:hypothetical protein
VLSPHNFACPFLQSAFGISSSIGVSISNRASTARKGTALTLPPRQAASGLTMD